MEFTKENCLKMKEKRRKELVKLSIDEKIKIVEGIRDRVEVIRNLRNKRINKAVVQVKK